MSISAPRDDTSERCFNLNRTLQLPPPLCHRSLHLDTSPRRSGSCWTAVLLLLTIVCELVQVSISLCSGSKTLLSLSSALLVSVSDAVYSTASTYRCSDPPSRCTCKCSTLRFDKLPWPPLPGPSTSSPSCRRTRCGHLHWPKSASLLLVQH